MLFRIEEQKVLKGRSVDAKVALVIFMAARNLKRPKPINDIIDYIRTTPHEINNCYKVLKKSNIFPELDTRLQSSDIVQKACNKLELSHPVCGAAKLTADNFKEHGICEGKRPNTIAGASLLLVTSLAKFEKDRVELEDIAKAVSIGEQAIRECYQEACKYS